MQTSFPNISVIGTHQSVPWLYCSLLVDYIVMYIRSSYCSSMVRVSDLILTHGAGHLISARNSEIVFQDLQTLDFVGLPQAFDLLFKSQIITNLPLYYRID